jgi:hypothetical protein
MYVAITGNAHSHHQWSSFVLSRAHVTSKITVYVYTVQHVHRYGKDGEKEFPTYLRNLFDKRF